MPLWMSSRRLGCRWRALGLGEVLVDLTGDVALEAADGLASGLAFGNASSNVVLGAFVPAQARDRDRVEGRICLSIAAAVEPASVRLARGCLDWADPAERGEGGLTGQALGVVAGGEQQRGGGIWSDAVTLQQLRRVGLDGCGDVDVEFVDLAGQRQDATGEQSQGQRGRARWVAGV